MFTDIACPLIFLISSWSGNSSKFAPVAKIRFCEEKTFSLLLYPFQQVSDLSFVILTSFFSNLSLLSKNEVLNHPARGKWKIFSFASTMTESGRSSHIFLSLFCSFSELGIEVRPVWKLNHSQKHFKIYQKYRIKKSSKIAKTHLCIPSSPDLKFSQQKFIYKIINSVWIKNYLIYW